MRLSKRMTMVWALLLSVIGADVCAQEVLKRPWIVVFLIKTSV